MEKSAEGVRLGNPRETAYQKRKDSAEDEERSVGEILRLVAAGPA